MDHRSLLATGEPLIWLTGGALAVCLLMIITLLTVVIVNAVGAFWPAPLRQVATLQGRVLLGEPFRHETFAPEASVIEALPPAARAEVQQRLAAAAGQSRRTLYRTGNFELTNEHFNWVSDFEVAEATEPPWGLVLERMEWGRFYGLPRSLLIDGKEVASTPEKVWQEFTAMHAAARTRWRTMQHLDRHDRGHVSARLENARLATVEAGLDHPPGSPQLLAAQQAESETQEWATKEYERIDAQIASLKAEIEKEQLELTAWIVEDGQARQVNKRVQLADIVRAYPANQLGWWGKLSIYFSRWWEFLSAEPREANSEGGVFPAIWGTVVMTMIMSLAVVPFGVLAALYLREYARGGLIVSIVRISINNLAGVPSIVFGVFGLGFFCYIIGAYVDGGPGKAGITPWPPAWWLSMLAVLAGLGVTGFLMGVYQLGGPQTQRTRSKQIIGWLAIIVWVVATLLLILLIFKSPYFDGLYRARLPNPTFGKGGLLWASLTLALLTLPVVIVATEEALAAVPNSMREGSYACGASKWQTIQRIVLPRALPGIMTGMILAMARGAGEVAPLMLVGAVKLAPELPVDLTFPFVHLDRSFMHLGFHIFDLGFQSQNSEAAVPMVFTTTLLLILIIAIMNLTAVWLRSRLRRKFVLGHF